MILKKNEESNKARKQIDKILVDLDKIYKNKSSDEYKCKGDITKSPYYEKLEYSVAQLSQIKGLSEADVTTLKHLFDTLHRPRFAKNVQAYLEKPTDENILYTLCFTVYYRMLIGEVSRIYASTEATDKGIVYKHSLIKRDEKVMVFIRKYSKDLDKKIDASLVKLSKTKTTVQEASVLESLNDGANIFVGAVEMVFGFFGNIFKGAAALNPISLISACLSRSYDKKIEKYDKISNEYEAAKKAYAEYQKIPAAQRKKRIEHAYVKQIEKYNIKMQNLKAQIDHYDLRANGDANDVGKTKATSTSGPKSSSTVDTSPSSDDSKGKTTTSDDFDF